jgi:hypothetical protein
VLFLVITLVGDTCRDYEVVKTVKDISRQTLTRVKSYGSSSTNAIDIETTDQVWSSEDRGRRNSLPQKQIDWPEEEMKTLENPMLGGKNKVGATSGNKKKRRLSSRELMIEMSTQHVQTNAVAMEDGGGEGDVTVTLGINPMHAAHGGAATTAPETVTTNAARARWNKLKQATRTPGTFRNGRKQRVKRLSKVMKARQNELDNDGGHSMGLSNCRAINLLTANQPGIYFLFDKDKKLIYIGESKFPVSRILDHYFKAYIYAHRSAKGIGPVFNHFRIVNCKSEDSRIRQHYEKRWIRKFKSLLNFNTKCETYDLNWKELNGFILVFEHFFKKDMTWNKYLNDEVISKRLFHKEKRKIWRKKYYIKKGK